MKRRSFEERVSIVWEQLNPDHEQHYIKTGMIEIAKDADARIAELEAEQHKCMGFMSAADVPSSDYDTGEELTLYERVECLLDWKDDAQDEIIDTVSAYEGLRHWTPVSTSPEKTDMYLVKQKQSGDGLVWLVAKLVVYDKYEGEWPINNVVAWLPIPDYSREEKE